MKEQKQPPVVILNQVTFHNIFILCLRLRIKRRSNHQCHIQQFLGGVGFLMSIARRITVVQPGSLGQHYKPSPVGSRGQNPGNFWLFCILNSSKHHSLGSATKNIDESLQFGIPSRYTGFKIALDTALIMVFS